MLQGVVGGAARLAAGQAFARCTFTSMAIAIKLKQVIYAHALRRASSRFTCSCRRGATRIGRRGGAIVVRVVDNACFGLKLSTWNAIFQTVYFLCKFAYIASACPRPCLTPPLILPAFAPRCRQSRRQAG